jgi:hypothetical protein
MDLLESLFLKELGIIEKALRPLLPVLERWQGLRLEMSGGGTSKHPWL